MKRGRLVLKRSTAAIDTLVTKFGGRPVWAQKAAWPISAATSEKMLFIGQIVIQKPLFPVDEPRIAYLFLTEEKDDNVGQLETWNPSSGESTVIIQKLGVRPSISEDRGPCLVDIRWENGERRYRPLELSAEVVIEEAQDIPAEELQRWDKSERIRYRRERSQVIGGEPDWLQEDEAPADWRLLLQMTDDFWLDGESVETNLNFGFGSCYVCISPDCSEGILLWQCT